MPDVCRAYDVYEAYEVYEVWKGLFLTPSTAANSFHRCGGPPPSRREVLGKGKSRVGKMSAGARCANSFHRCGGPPPSRREVWGRGNREFAECRRARDARPYNVAENCNCEMCLQRWVASLQRLDAFATVGCTAVLRRGAHCAPVYLRCYNNLSRGRAKGLRGDRKAPISNRRQGRRP